MYIYINKNKYRREVREALALPVVRHSARQEKPALGDARQVRGSKREEVDAATEATAAGAEDLVRRAGLCAALGNEKL